MAFPPRAPILVTWYPSGQPERLPAMAEVAGLRWAAHADNPLVAPPMLAPSLRDPTFLPPSETPDGRWHLLARSALGLHHHVSNDGLRWTRLPGIVARDAERPHLCRGEGRYHLVSEASVAKVPWLPAERRLELRSSVDLVRWSAPRLLLQAGLPWHRDGARQGVGHASLIRLSDRYRLYYCAGPGALAGIAESASLDRPLLPETEPLGRDAMGGLRLLPLADGLLGLRVDPAGAIELLTSVDGRGFQSVAVRPLPAGQRVIGGFDARWLEGRLLLYAAIRGERSWSRGGVGLVVAS